MKKAKFLSKLNKENFDKLKDECRWIYSYAKKHIWAIVGYTLLGMTGTLVTLVGSFASRDMVDIITGHLTGELIKTFCVIIAVQLLSMVISQTSTYVSTFITTKVDNSIKADMYDTIMTSDWETLTEKSSGYISARWAGDTSTVSLGLLSLLPNLIIYLFKLGTSLSVVVQNDPTFALFALISVPAGYLVSRTNMKRLQKKNSESMNISSTLSLFLNESFTNTQNVKAFDLVGLYSRKLKKLQKDSMKVKMDYQKVTNTNSVILTLVTIFVTYSTLGWGVYRVWSGDITYGSMTMLIGLSNSLAASVQSLLNLIPSAAGLFVATGRLMEFEIMPKEDYSQTDEVRAFYEKHRDAGVAVLIHDGSFTYRNGNEVFEDVDFEATPRETVALIGPSGEGKTTFLRLLLSIINSKSGEALISSEGETMPLTASARQLMAYVPQGNSMFAGTIAENMRNVKEDATEEEIIEALKTACAWEFVSRLPDGIESEIKERGGGFSEGQAQRLSIARALLRKSPILLLDEATSALDMDTERRLLDNISKDQYPRTCIVTTHRPEVMDVCDRIYLIKDQKLNLQEAE